MGRIKGRRRGPLRVRDDQEARLAASRELGWARRTLQILRTIFIIDFVIMGLLFALFTQVEGGEVLKLITGGVALAALFGAIFVVKQPVIWCFLLAILHSIPAALSVLAFQVAGHLSFGGIIRIAFAVLLWLAVKMAIRTEELLETYGDLAAAKRLRGESSGSGEISTKWQEKARARRKQRYQTMGIAAACCAVGIALVVLLGGKKDEPAGGGSPEPRLTKPTAELAETTPGFETAWSSQGVAGISPFLADSERNRLMRGMNKMIRRHKWNRAGLPKLLQGTEEKHGESQRYMHYDVEGYGTTRISWEWEKDRWVVVRWRFKRAEDG